MEYQVKDVVGYEGLYEVSNTGEVWSLNYHKTKKRKKLKLYVKKDGYLEAVLCRKGKMEYRKVHRLVAQAFIPNPNEYPCINHKDENKQNNCVENLEWCTVAYNNEYSNIYEKSAKATSKPILQYTLDGQFVREYSSIMEAHRQTGLLAGNICQCCKGKHGHIGGYKWEYKKEG